MNGQVIAQYRLEAELGRGTYGAVYKGVHVEVPTLVRAVKVLHPELIADPDFRRAVANEVELLARLDHPGIVRLYDLVVEPDRVALLLELLHGEDLLRRSQRGPMPVDQAIDVLLMMLDALGAAHAAGVVHADIKPANVFICGDGAVKLLDFGVSRAAEASETTRTARLVGTFHYMAPEVFDGRITPAVDVYAAGLVAWEMLTGAPACKADTAASAMKWHLVHDPVDLGSARADAPGWLRDALRALTAPDGRPADGAAAAALVRDLRARPPSRFQGEARGPTRTLPPETVSPERGRQLRRELAGEGAGASAGAGAGASAGGQAGAGAGGPRSGAAAALLLGPAALLGAALLGATVVGAAIWLRPAPPEPAPPEPAAPVAQAATADPVAPATPAAPAPVGEPTFYQSAVAAMEAQDEQPTAKRVLSVRPLPRADDPALDPNGTDIYDALSLGVTADDFKRAFHVPLLRGPHVCFKPMVDGPADLTVVAVVHEGQVREILIGENRSTPDMVTCITDALRSKKLDTTRSGTVTLHFETNR